MFKKIITFLCINIIAVMCLPILSTNAGLIELNQTNSNDLNLRVGSYKTVGNQLSKNQPLNDFGNDQFYNISGGGERSLYYSLVKIAKDFKNFMFAIATLFFFIITLRLLLAGNTEEELGKYKKGIIWITIGLVVMQIAYSFVVSIYDQGVSAGVAYRLLDYVVNPLIRLLETIASVFFL
jgi:hypothetical protein